MPADAPPGESGQHGGEHEDGAMADEEVTAQGLALNQAPCWPGRVLIGIGSLLAPGRAGDRQRGAGRRRAALRQQHGGAAQRAGQAEPGQGQGRGQRRGQRLAERRRGAGHQRPVTPNLR